MRLNTDGEMLALRGAGLSLLRLTRPALFFGLGATVLTMIVSVWILRSATRLQEPDLRDDPPAGRRGLAGRDLQHAFEGLTLYVEHLNPKTSEMEGVFLVDSRNRWNSASSSPRTDASPRIRSSSGWA